MLKLSTKGRYGVRALMELARYEPGEPVLMSTIAEQQHISRKYLHALLTSLRTAGLVRSVRGAQGGYTLGRPPAEIPIHEAIEALEGPMALTDCVADEKLCSRAPFCVARKLWKDMSNLLIDHLSGMTLQDLVSQQEEACALFSVKSKAPLPRGCPERPSKVRAGLRLRRRLPRPAEPQSKPPAEGSQDT